jgi:hypothetical protein
VLIAVLYSAETGEEFANYMMHPRSEKQLKFLSGFVKIAIASTPQAFGTDKICSVVENEVKNLQKPVVI